jgi:hypothetical protein
VQPDIERLPAQVHQFLEAEAHAGVILDQHLQHDLRIPIDLDRVQVQRIVGLDAARGRMDFGDRIRQIGQHG